MTLKGAFLSCPLEEVGASSCVVEGPQAYKLQTDNSPVAPDWHKGQEHATAKKLHLLQHSSTQVSLPSRCVRIEYTA